MKITVTRRDGNHHLALAAERQDVDGFRRDAQSLAVYGDDTLLMVAVLDNIGAQGPDVHFAAFDPRWTSRKAMTTLARVLFQPAPHGFGFVAVRAVIDTSNIDMQIVALRSGFRFLASLPAGVEREHGVVLMHLDALDCRWLPPTSRDLIERARSRGNVIDGA